MKITNFGDATPKKPVVDRGLGVFALRGGPNNNLESSTSRVRCLHSQEKQVAKTGCIAILLKESLASIPRPAQWLKLKVAVMKALDYRRCKSKHFLGGSGILT